MADEIVARNEGGNFTPHPEGQFPAVCVDTINMGEKVEQYQDNPKQLVKKCALVFQTDERDEKTTKPLTIAIELTLSFGKKANLRHLLEQWRGKGYTDDEVDAGVPLHKLVGQPALISVEHKRSKGGNLYGKINAVTKLPKGLPAPSVDYTRAEYWETRKAEYAKVASAFRQEIGAPESFDDYPPSGGPPDDETFPF